MGVSKSSVFYTSGKERQSKKQKYIYTFNSPNVNSFLPEKKTRHDKFKNYKNVVNYERSEYKNKISLHTTEIKKDKYYFQDDKKNQRSFSR